MNSMVVNPGKVVVEYFNFEQDFLEDNIRCIPMIVRYKLDKSGIKLKLKEWSRMTVEERENLAALSLDSSQEQTIYREYLEKLIRNYSKEEPAYLSVEQQNSSLVIGDDIPQQLQDKASELKLSITENQWRKLNTLQRYSLLKLARPGHESKNFPLALKEFGLISH